MPLQNLIITAIVFSALSAWTQAELPSDYDKCVRDMKALVPDTQPLTNKQLAHIYTQCS